ncbi:MAG: multifunctional oxoglutarate decarboxylase/oxoglutarate dehydrogenase thiamine pyrophosphate-binding subunit/dihydrolipoyllysine-residue succinyltransferase subunit [Thermoanaerobaculia bacterium]
MSTASPYGTNIAFIEELFEKYQHDPSSVSESWREFFQDYVPEEQPGPDGQPEEETPQPARTVMHAPIPSRPAPVQARPALAPVPAPAAVPPSGTLTPLRGAPARIVQNMEASLTVPTATSVRNIPVKVLEENRRIINQHLSLIGQPKASFTHIIAWAIVKSLNEFPRMNSSFAMEDGQPVRIDRDHVNFGIAIDVEKKDGSRSLLVPNVKNAQSLDFWHFLRSYNDLVRKARSGSLQIPDFEGTTISLTNPGTIGTVSSIPRLMQGQGSIIATGQIDFPPEYAGTDPRVAAEIGISKVMTMTSTYDHRIIQGAESGQFLARIHALLLGTDNFYDEIFRDLRIPYEPVSWSRDLGVSFLSGARSEEVIRKEAGVLQMINAYRVRGHLLGDLDPLEYHVGHHAELNPIYYKLTIWDLDREFITGGLSGKPKARLREILDVLRETYCGKIGPEYMHIQNPVEKKWLQERMEPSRNGTPLDDATKRRILLKLNDAEAFEKFLHTKYVGHKRFSLEGAETLVPMLDALLSEAADSEMKEVVLGMSHRGRLNVLANIVGKSYEKIFYEFEGDIDPNTTQGSGDVKYHLGARGTHVAPSSREVGITLASNPSHLEAVDPIVEGMTRATQKLLRDTERRRVMSILLHGDAAFAGQGVVAETLNLSQLKGYRTGGTIHIVVNNQIGFTTGPESARSTVYATDVAKMVQAPIFHVNGDDPEACIRVVKLAFEYRQQFKKDVVIDMICYRRHGHNEADDPSLTQPKMYKLIKDHRSVRKLYTESLLRKGDLGPQEAEQWLDSFRQRLQEAFDKTHGEGKPPEAHRPLWSDEEITGLQNEPSPDTGIETDELRRIGEALTTVPETFTLHPKLKPFVKRRASMVEGNDPLDWATAESIAFGSLLLEGHRVRLSGQDSARGTFSQRHAIFYDYESGERFIPLNQLANREESVELPNGEVAQSAGPITFAVYDSLLSEYGALGFEYGYSVVDKTALVLWEAQFGDFMNGAQIIIDQFISSAEEKWDQHSGLVLLLPHGYEGQGPEHSSARLERFLTLCAEGNMQVANPSTPAQYFHLLRRQVRVQPRKPLIITTPKSLLRHPAAVSQSSELLQGRFEPVLDDPKLAAADEAAANAVTRIVLASGKVYYDLASAKDELGRDDVAVVRLEQFYPFPEAMLDEIFAKYRNARSIAWTQEEPRNMGGWDFVKERLLQMVGQEKLHYVGRPVSASPATGSHHRHETEQKALAIWSITGERAQS